MSIYRFKVFQLDAERRYLLKEGQFVPLTAKLFDILLLLVQKRGELVTKDDLMKEIWADQIVEDNNITVNVSALRKILDEGNPGYEFIETVPKRGYRFVAQVSVLEESFNAATKPQIQSQKFSHINYKEDVCSLAVMPLVNESRDPGLEYFSDGVTDSIIYSLSQLPQLRVLARNTVFQYKGRELNAQEAGQSLGVEAVLIGRVLQFEDRLILRTELINSGDGSILWGEQYNRPMSDIFAIQEEVAKEVSEKLQLKLTGDDRRRIAKRYTDNHEAYQLYLKGRYFWNKFNKEWVQKSIHYFQQAIETDPEYALAYAGLTDAYLRLAALYLSPREVLAEAKANALKAVELDDQLAEAHAALGLVKSWFDFDWAGAEKEHQRAVALNPASYLAHEAYGRHFKYLGRFDEALREFEYAIQLDPLFLQLYVDLGATLYMIREYDRAIEQFQKVLDIIPNYYPARYALAWGYFQKQDFQAAITELEQIWQQGEDAYLALGLLSYVHSVSGDKNKAKKILKNLEKWRANEYVSSYSLVLAYLGLGNTEKVFEWLEELYEDRGYWLAWLNIVPELAHLRSEPRFKDLLARVGLINKTELNDAGKTLAVLPFVCIGENPELENLSDGLTETIIENLSHSAKLRVTPTGETTQYKGRQFDSVGIGRELETETILVGRVLRTGEKLIIVTELIDVGESARLKIEQFECQLSDSFAVQKAAAEISERLKFALKI